MSIKIVTDSTADLSTEEIKKLDIHVIPLSISIGGETFLDRVDITPEQFLEKMKSADELPKSSQPAVGKFVELYENLGADGSEILSIHMTGGMSGTVEAARSAAEMVSVPVTVVDSEFISKALAFQVEEAARLASEGKTLKEILAAIEKVREHTKLYVVVDTLENLAKGGRIGKGRAMIGSLLNIKPIAMLKEGVYSPVAKVRSHSQVVKYVIKHFTEDIQGKTLKSVALTHAEGLELASRIKEEIISLTGIHEVSISATTPVISTHTGIGAIGFSYYTE